MEILALLIGVPVIVGVVLAVIEWRRRAVFLKHDLSLKGPQTETQREGERAAQAMREAHFRNRMDR